MSILASRTTLSPNRNLRSVARPDEDDAIRRIRSDELASPVSTNVALFDRDAFGEVARFIDVPAELDGKVIGQ
jgi:hypothetical protein